MAELDSGNVSAANAKEVLAEAFESGASPRAIIEQRGLGQVSDAGLIGEAVAWVLQQHAQQVAEYRAGKLEIYGFLVGQVMKRTAGRAHARLVNEELRRQLEDA
jgi:aspartyl-tRNA(Asn)/glutamyl-tRNA(Gln) amidotransferase subunit B